MTSVNLSGYLEASATRWPARPAVVDSTGRTLDYASLHRQADVVARFLVSRGVTRGDRVGIALPKCIEAVVAIFGILRAGAAYVPVDVSAPAERGRRILSDCQVRAVFVHGRSQDLIPPGELQAVVVVDPVADSMTASFVDTLSVPDVPLGEPAGVDDVAVVLYTSGSTGNPKGVMLTHGNAISFLDWCSDLFQPTEEDRFSSHAPFHFDPSIFDLYLSVKHGASVHLIPSDLGKKPEAVAQFIQDHRLTIWLSTPSILTLLLKFAELTAYDASSLRLVMFGGEVFPVRYLRALQQLWPAAVYYNLYGPTEATTACTFARIPNPIPDDREAPFPIGFPGAHCRARILSPAGGDVEPGEVGLLYVSGPPVFAGYWGRPEETASVFVVRDGARWYNTGDLVRWNEVEGYTYVGRHDRMVKRRGFRIELGEIERALYSHPAVQEAAVASTTDRDGGVRIVAFLACPDGTPPSLIDLKAFCAEVLPPYMSPDKFVVLDRLPRTSTDKVDYQALQMQLGALKVA